MPVTRSTSGRGLGAQHTSTSSEETEPTTSGSAAATTAVASSPRLAAEPAAHQVPTARAAVRSGPEPTAATPAAGHRAPRRGRTQAAGVPGSAQEEPTPPALAAHSSNVKTRAAAAKPYAAGPPCPNIIVHNEQVQTYSSAAHSIAKPTAAAGLDHAVQVPPVYKRVVSTSRDSRRSTFTVRLAHAKEEYARLQVELAAAKIVSIEAEESESIDDARTEVTDEGATQHRVNSWLHHSETHLAIAEPPNAGDTERPPVFAEQQPPPLQPPPLLQTPAPPPRTQPLPPVEPTDNPIKRYEYQPYSYPSHEAIAAPIDRAVAIPSPKSDIAELAAAITAAAKQSQVTRHFADLPIFNGSHQDWLLFKTSYNETACMFSDSENAARLRRNLKGKAREAVESLLINRSHPIEIIRCLESRFGRPDAIASTELERLRNLTKPTDNPRDICIFASKVSNTIASLQALNKTHYLYNPEITKLTSEKLSPTLRHRWYDFAAAQHLEEPDLIKLARFLNREAELCGPFAQPENVTSSWNETANRRPQRTNVTQDNTVKCAHCNNTGHYIVDCKTFLAADVNKRWDIAKEQRLCFKCLKFRNRQHACKPKRCDTDGCTHTHHRLLHSQKQVKTEAVTSTWTRKRAHAFLKVAPVTIAGPAGKIDTWALLDDGSTVTLLNDNIANQIGARGPHEQLNIEAIGDTTLQAARSRRVSVTLYGKDGKKYQIASRTIDGLNLSPQQVRNDDLAGCTHLQDIEHLLLTDGATPQLLIGQDNWHLLIADEMRTGRRDQPVASRTPLGWVLHGAQTRTIGHKVNFIQDDVSMDEQLRQHFAIESMLITPKRPHSDPNRIAQGILDQTTVQLPDGHYQTALLWQNDDRTMPYNYDAAERRLLSIEKKLSKDKDLARKYSEQMSSLIEKGYAELAPAEKTPHKTWYLPHFAVINPLKPGKIRIVHDAAAKTQGKSLNNYLLTGPDLLQSLPGVLMRFRQHEIAVSADIAEMFMQVKVRPIDRDALRYLWREDACLPPTEYRMTSLIFGATCSPSTAIYIKDVNARKYEDEFPNAVRAITRNHYVDDYLDSFKTIEDAIETSLRVKEIHSRGHFDLRKWTSNSYELLKRLNETGKSTDITISDGSDNNIERVLGLVWKSNADVLTFNLDLARVPEETLTTTKPTKREALKIVMSLYDPLGFASPVTVRAKQILQELWRRGNEWDQPIDDDLATQWREWMGHLNRLRDVTVPRCYLHYSDAVTLQLHTLVDASESAYSCIIFWRAVTPDGKVTLSIVTAKARVAPLKLTSIPRLELQAAVMGSRMASAVIEEHDRKPDARYYWTDSKTVLTWIRTGSRSYKPFVAHRIAEIEENTTVSEWKWVPTKLNIADDATRDVPADFDSSHRWFTGPPFLLQEEADWPVENTQTKKPTGEEKCIHTKVVEPTIHAALPDATRFSRWERYLRTTARILQFIDLCRTRKETTLYKRNRKNKESDPAWTARQLNSKVKPKTNNIEKPTLTRHLMLSATLLRRAEDLIIRSSQQMSFSDEIRALQNGYAVASRSRLRLISMVYTDGILRVKSRINNIKHSDIEKSPLILDGNRHEVQLLIEYTHRQLSHAGTELIINEIRQRFWVLRLRPITRTLVHRCVPCRIRKAIPPQPATGDHPPTRFAHHQRSFAFTGHDFFGPVSVVVGRTTQKRYVALYTCLTSRAIHLEITASLTTHSAVMALRRMIARRGCPTEIWSDNGTNLRGADRELRQAMLQATEEEANQRSILWRYIPPGAPFMGGAWERLVGAVKRALAATLERHHPTDEVLATLVAEAEYTVNSRPLTHVSVHPDDPEALTPNHFLIGGSGRTMVPGTFDDSDLIGRTHWRASQRLADIFWSRWLREYLPDLQHRRDIHNRGPTVKVGDVVLIVDHTLPRNTWPKGRVTATYPGADGIVRVADVATRGGLLRRPVKKIVILPTDPAAPAPSQSQCTDT